jgi:hypothetical protein
LATAAIKGSAVTTEVQDHTMTNRAGILEIDHKETESDVQCEKLLPAGLGQATGLADLIA